MKRWFKQICAFFRLFPIAKMVSVAKSMWICARYAVQFNEATKQIAESFRQAIESVPGMIEAMQGLADAMVEFGAQIEARNRWRRMHYTSWNMNDWRRASREWASNPVPWTRTNRMRLIPDCRKEHL